MQRARATLATFAAMLLNLHAQVIDIPTSPAPERLELSRSRRALTLYRGEVALKTYRVAVGRPGWETPLGQFHVFQMVRDPAWKHPLTHKIFPSGAAGNELGHYWIGFSTDGDTAIGFHGTPHPETVGRAASHGCVRMHERDIAELFQLVAIGTVVSVVP